MSLKDNLKATGMVTFQQFNAAGELVLEKTVPNLVVTSGLGFIAARMATTGQPTQMTHMAIGSSSQTPAAGDTALIAQLGSRVALSTAGGTPSGSTVTYTASFGAGVSTGAVVEAGIFNAATAGTMLCRTTFPVINKNAGDSLVITWVITVS